KYVSNDRFSCWMITMCLILWMPVDAEAELVDAVAVVGADRFEPLLQPAATSATNATPIKAVRIPRTVRVRTEARRARPRCQRAGMRSRPGDLRSNPDSQGASAAHDHVAVTPDGEPSALQGNKGGPDDRCHYQSIDDARRSPAHGSRRDRHPHRRRAPVVDV